MSSCDHYGGTQVSSRANYGGQKCLLVNTTGGHKSLPGRTTGWRLKMSCGKHYFGKDILITPAACVNAVSVLPLSNVT